MLKMLTTQTSGTIVTTAPQYCRSGKPCGPLNHCQLKIQPKNCQSTSDRPKPTSEIITEITPQVRSVCPSVIRR